MKITTVKLVIITNAVNIITSYFVEINSKRSKTLIGLL